MSESVDNLKAAKVKAFMKSVWSPLVHLAAGLGI
jgi:hypothetical protein